MNKLAEKLNGKKRYIGGVGAIGSYFGIRWIVTFLIGFNTILTATATQVEVNTKVIESLIKLPERMRGVEVAQEALKEKVVDGFKIQEKVNDRILDKLDMILAK